MPPSLLLWILTITQRYPISSWMTQNVFQKNFQPWWDSFILSNYPVKILWKYPRAQCLPVTSWIREAPGYWPKEPKQTIQVWIRRLSCDVLGGQEPILILFSPLPTCPFPVLFPLFLSLSCPPACLSWNWLFSILVWMFHCGISVRTIFRVKLIPVYTTLLPWGLHSLHTPGFPLISPSALGLTCHV